MKGVWTVTNTHSAFRSEMCVLCGRVAKIGQVVYLLHPPMGRIVQHKGCLALLFTEDIPTEATEIKFNEIREAIVATGSVFTEA